MSVVTRIRAPRIKILLTGKEAEMLCSLIGGVGGVGKTRLGSLYKQLDDQMPEREKSYSDYFVGDVRALP